MQDNWYESSYASEDSWYTPYQTTPSAGAPPRRKRRRWIRTLSLIFVVAAATCGVLYWLDHKPTPPEQESSAPGSAVPEIGQYELPKNYRDYFNKLYGTSIETEDCNIPRVDSFDSSISLTLTNKGTQPLSYTEIYQQCAPTVVAIHAYVDKENADGFYWGTGFIVHPDGYIVTNSHIIEGTSYATVTLWDDRVFDALLVGQDSRNDLAVLKIEASNLPSAEFCDSDAMEIGETVVAIGNPLGEEFRSTMTEGILSGTSRSVSYNGATLELLQTSAPLNEGNSGGPLINQYGQVIGVTNMKMNSSYGAVTIEGLGFAIPSQTVKTLTDAIFIRGEVTGRPALGIVVGVIPQPAREYYELPEGLYISEVKHGSDGEAKGIVAGDILLKVNGDVVTETEHVLDKIDPLSVGDTLDMTIWRDGEILEIKVELVDMNRVY